MKKNKKNIHFVTLTFLMMTIVLTRIVKNPTKLLLFDKVIMDYIHRNNNLTGIFIMKFISLLGSPTFFLTIGLSIFVYFWRSKKFIEAKLILLSIGGSYILNATLKIIFARTRPLTYMLIEKAGYSFPSGHSMVSMSFYTTLTYILLKNIKDKKIKIFIWIGNFVVIGSIGFSRLYLGVHWPTDVIVGFILGFIFFVITKTIVRD